MNSGPLNPIADHPFIQLLLFVMCTCVDVTHIKQIRIFCGMLHIDSHRFTACAINSMLQLEFDRMVNENTHYAYYLYVIIENDTFPIMKHLLLI